MTEMKWGWPKATCSFCDSPSVTSFVVEAGNGAEVKVHLELCGVHDKEHDRNESAFAKKYEEVIDRLAAEVGVDAPEGDR